MTKQEAYYHFFRCLSEEDGEKLLSIVEFVVFDIPFIIKRDGFRWSTFRDVIRYKRWREWTA